eukprot:gene3178-biopygen20930
METIVNKEPPDKRTRPDRAAKIKDRKNGEENVVKCTLSRIIADKDNKDVITKVIKERVDSVSKRTYLAGVAVNRILKEVFEGVPDAQLHTVSVPSVDQNFIRQLMVGSRQAHMETRDATVESSVGRNIGLGSSRVCEVAAPLFCWKGYWLGVISVGKDRKDIVGFIKGGEVDRATLLGKEIGLGYSVGKDIGLGSSRVCEVAAPRCLDESGVF